MHRESASGRVCAALNADGTPCRARPRPGSAFCFTHDPDLRARLQAARSRGGANSSNIARARRALPGDLREVLGRLEQALSDVLEGSLAPQAASAAASVARSIVAVRDAGDLERRLAELEAAVGLEVQP